VACSLFATVQLCPWRYFRSLQITHCSRNNGLNAMLIGLKYSESGVVFSSWKQPDDYLYEIIQASAWMIYIYFNKLAKK